MKKKIFITGSSGFIGFHISKKLLDKKFKVHGFDSMNNYYDVRLKKARYNILKKYKIFLLLNVNLKIKKNYKKLLINSNQI